MSTTQKILRCLMMTHSKNDNEALVAIRKANQLLAVCDMNWEQFLGMNPGTGEEPQMKGKTDQEIMEMLNVVKSNLQRTGSSALEFVESLERQFLAKGSLSPKQINALKKFYNNARVPF